MQRFQQCGAAPQAGLCFSRIACTPQRPFWQAAIGDQHGKQLRRAAWVVALETADRRKLGEVFFDRWMDGSWAPSGDGVFISNHEGSSTSDCLVWNRSSTTSGLVSLTKVLLDDPKSGPVSAIGAKPVETPDNAHFYLTCTRWVSDEKIAVDLHGVTSAGGEFRYDMMFEVAPARFQLATSNRSRTHRLQSPGRRDSTAHKAGSLP